ncbi:MAG: M23 family metallopeptidase [Candidatus Babeliales bacterium]
MNKIKGILYLIVFFIISYSCVSGYHYFFGTAQPTIKMEGIARDQYYGNEIPCKIYINDSYKIAEISAWLDDKPLFNKNKINTKICEYPFTISTVSLKDGQHTLKIQAENGLYNRKKTTQEVSFFVDNKLLHAAVIKNEPSYKVNQGRTLRVKLQVNKPIKQAFVEVFNKSYQCFPESKNSSIYDCFMPVMCEEKPGDYVIHIQISDLVGNTVKLDEKLQVAQFPFKRQNLKVDPEKVKKEKEIGLSDDQLEKELEVLAQKSPFEKLWNGIFYAPTEIKAISTEYGTIRVTQEKGRYMHKALDIVNAPKSIIWAPQDGRVVIKERYALSGNTVVIDHGCGILSLFYHLDDFAENLKVGMNVKQGNPLGTLGKTGYASGYHLHWEMRIHNIAVDPQQWIDQYF